LDNQNKNDWSIFQSFVQRIDIGNSDDNINICSGISWDRTSYLKKNLIIWPIGYFDFFEKAASNFFKSIINHKFYAKDALYFYQFDKDHPKN